MPALGPSTPCHREKASKAALWCTSPPGRSMDPWMGSRPPADHRLGHWASAWANAPFLAYLCIPQVRKERRSHYYWVFDKKTWIGHRPLPALDRSWEAMVALTSIDCSWGWQAMACLQNGFFVDFRRWSKALPWLQGAISKAFGGMNHYSRHGSRLLQDRSSGSPWSSWCQP